MHNNYKTQFVILVAFYNISVISMIHNIQSLFVQFQIVSMISGSTLKKFIISGFFLFFPILKIANEVNQLSLLFYPVIGIIECRWKPRKEDAVLWCAVLLRCAWMKFSCSIKSARGALYYVKALLFICFVVFFSRATKCVYLELCSKHRAYMRREVHYSWILNAAHGSGSSVFWYFHLVANSHRFSSRAQVFCARIFAKRYKRMYDYLYAARE